MYNFLKSNCSSFIKEVPYKVTSNFRGFDDTETYFESESPASKLRILGFNIDKEIFNHYTKKYKFIIKESNKIHTFDIVIDWDSTDRFDSIKTSELFNKTQYSKKIYFRIVKTDAYGNQHVLIVNDAKIYMLVSKDRKGCEILECVETYEEWRILKSKSKGNSCNTDYHDLYYSCLLYTSPSPRDS